MILDYLLTIHIVSPINDISKCSIGNQKYFTILTLNERRDLSTSSKFMHSQFLPKNMLGISLLRMFKSQVGEQKSSPKTAPLFDPNFYSKFLYSLFFFALIPTKFTNHSGQNLNNCQIRLFCYWVWKILKLNLFQIYNWNIFEFVLTRPNLIFLEERNITMLFIQMR